MNQNVLKLGNVWVDFFLTRWTRTLRRLLCLISLPNVSIKPTWLQGCLQLCKDYPGCKWYTFDPTLKDCELFEYCKTISSVDCPHCLTGEVDCHIFQCSVPGICQVKLSRIPRFTLNFYSKYVSGRLGSQGGWDRIRTAMSGILQVLWVLFMVYFWQQQ